MNRRTFLSSLPGILLVPALAPQQRRSGKYYVQLMAWPTRTNFDSYEEYLAEINKTFDALTSTTDEVNEMSLSVARSYGRRIAALVGQG